MIDIKKKAAAGIEESELRTDLRWCFEKIRSEAFETVEKSGKNQAQQQTLLSEWGNECS